MLYSIDDAMMLLGAFANRPNLMLSDKYKIGDNDFKCKGCDDATFHNILYRVMYNLVASGAEEIDHVIVDTFLRNYPKQYEICKQYDFMAFIQEIKQIASSDNVQYHYDIVRKFAMLREYKAAGFNITELYDETKDENLQRDNLNSITLRDIDSYFESKRLAIKRDFVSTENIEHYKAGSDFKEIKEQFKVAPKLGLSFQSPYLNDIYRGIMGLTLRSGASGCVDADTEFFNGFGWKKISEYSDGDKVLQYNVDGSTNLVSPIRYIKLHCNEMWHFETKYGLNQTLSDEHNVVYITSKGNLAEKPMSELVQMHNSSKHGFGGKFITTFHYNGNGITLTDNEIRVMCAVICDGTFNYRLLEKNKDKNDWTKCRFHLKKERKKHRLRMLFRNAHITFREYESAAEGYTDFVAYVPLRCKEFGDDWYHCTNAQMKIICDEVMFWDGDYKRKTCFSTTSKKTADFIQYAFSCTGNRATIHIDDRRSNRKDGKTIYHNICYDVIVSKKTSGLCSISGKGKNKINIERVNTIDGYKYCFTVPSHMLVLRRNNRIFISGNSGKTTLSIGDACMSGVPYYYDTVKKKYVKNKSYVGAVLFINTEMDLREELDIMFISWISAVPRQKILDGLYMHDEEERVDKACKILEMSCIHVVDNPDFTTKSLEEIIEDYILDKNVKLVVFDYVQNQGYVANELAQESGIPMREDMVLLTLTDRLKQISRRHKVPILTGTQLNGRELEMPYPTEACLAGGKSQIRKADASMIITSLTNKQLDEIEPYIMTYPDLPKPNLIVHSIKGRSSKFPKYIRVYQYVDLGTGRSQDLYATYKDLSPINDIERLIIHNE